MDSELFWELFWAGVAVGVILVVNGGIVAMALKRADNERRVRELKARMTERQQASLHVPDPRAEQSLAELISEAHANRKVSPEQRRANMRIV